MDLELVFSIANTAAFFCWILLFVLYQKRWVYRVLFSIVLTGFALLYLIFIMQGIAVGQGGVDSLSNVKLLFSIDEAVLAGWIHYLAFDLFVGMWICHDANLRKINRWVLIPCLLLTFMLGPAGLLLYVLIRTLYLRKFPQDPYVERLMP